MWGMLAVLGLVTVILGNFILPRNLTRFVLLAVLWLVVFEVLQIIVALILINLSLFSKPE